MITQMDCPSCTKKISLPGNAAGKKFKCPFCSGIFSVPGAGQPEPPPGRPAVHDGKESIISTLEHTSQARTMPGMAAAREDEILNVLPGDDARSALARPAFRPFSFPVAVKRDPERTMKGQFRATIQPDGLWLHQKGNEFLVPAGNAAEYHGGNLFSVVINDRHVQLAVTGGNKYQSRLAGDLVQFLRGKKRSLREQDYVLAWYVYVPALLPFGIPIATLGGWIPAMIGFGLGSACLAIARQHKIPPALRVLAALGISGAAYLVIAMLYLVQFSQHWSTNNTVSRVDRRAATATERRRDPEPAPEFHPPGADARPDDLPKPPPPIQPDPQLLAADTKVFLSDLKQVANANFHSRGTAGKPGFVHTNFGDTPIIVHGKRSEHGLGMHTPYGGGGCTVRYALAKKARVFKCIVALNDASGHQPVTFHVVGDGKELWKSPIVHFPHEPVECSVDVGDVDELELRVQALGSWCDSYAVWVEPRLFKDADEAAREPSALVVRTSIRVTEGEIPQSIAGNQNLAGDRLQYGQAFATPLKLKTDGLAPCLCWSADGKSFYYLDGPAGKLGKIALDGLRETRRLEIGRKCTWLSTSAEGLLVTVSDSQELWVVDENELRVKDRLHVPSASRVVSAPPLSVAFSVVPANDFMGCPRLLILDLKTGEQVDGPSPSYSRRGDRPRLDGALVSADGKYLFAHDKRLIRFKIEGAQATLDQGSLGLGSGHVESLALSPDSKYVCLPIGGGNPGVLPDHPPLQGATFVYPVSDLRRPAFTLGRSPLVIAFDPAGKSIYGWDGNILTLYGASGTAGGQINFSERRADGKQRIVQSTGSARSYILVHPSGRKLVLLSSPPWFVELPATAMGDE